MTNTRPRAVFLAFTLVGSLAVPAAAQRSIPTTTRTRIPTLPQAPAPTPEPALPPPFTRVVLPNADNALYGMSFADIDRDGDADLYNNNTGRTWENRSTALGRKWVHLDMQDLYRPDRSVPIVYHYAASLADFDNDGMPDLATAPHTDSDPLEIFFNTGGDITGGVLWTEMVLSDMSLVDANLLRSFETHCWGDMDGDGALDLFAPAYSRADPSSSGNLFLQGKAEAPWRFENQTTLGFGNPSQCSCFFGIVTCARNPCRDCRPEGAQMFDLDDDGDLDIYCNGTTYLNVSTLGVPTAIQLDDSSTGIGFISELDEGAVLSDVDMDGDFDLVVNYASSCERTPGAAVVNTMFLWMNRGDGTFYEAGGSSYFVDELLAPNPSASNGRRNGLSLADWDGDGDPDLIGRGIFRVNQLVDAGTLQFRQTTAPVSFPPNRDALAAFADWDLDGDLDTAIATWTAEGHFFENTTFDAESDLSERPYLRVRPLRDDEDVAAGLETEFGAVVEVRVVNSELPLRRRQFVSSAGGYLNQHEYALTFGLNGPNLPEAPEVEISVDFPAVAGQPRIRVDKLVNHVLGSILPLAMIEDADRQFDVYRNGDVLVGGILHPANSDESRERFMAGADPISGLALQSLGAPLEPLTSEAASVGIDFETLDAEDDLWISELIIDGRLSEVPDVCDLGTGNIALWDITDPSGPILVSDSWIDAKTPEGNHRTSIPVMIRIQKERSYRLVAKMAEYRVSTVDPPDEPVAGLRFHGSFVFSNDEPCEGFDVMGASPDPAVAHLSFRYGK